MFGSCRQNPKIYNITVRSTVDHTYVQTILRDIHSVESWSDVSLKEVKGTVCETIFNMIKLKIGKNALVSKIELHNLEINAEFLKKLCEVVQLKTGVINSLSLIECNVNISTKELEDFISPLELSKFYCENNSLEGAKYSEKLLSSVQREIFLYNCPDEEVELVNEQLQITDTLLQEWEKKKHSFHLVLSGIKTSFTFIRVTQVIESAIAGDSYKGWNFGIVSGGLDDCKYLIDLQKLAGAHVKISGREYLVMKENKKGKSVCCKFEFDLHDDE